MEGVTNKTGRNLIIGEFVNSKRKESIFVSDNTTPAEKIDDIVENFGRSSAKIGQN